jgi:hypothetical protein
MLVCKDLTHNQEGEMLRFFFENEIRSTIEETDDTKGETAHVNDTNNVVEMINNRL